MGIDFKPERWDEIRKNYGLWWEGKLDRPVIQAVLTGKDPGRSQPTAPYLSQANCGDLSISAKDLIDRIDYELSKKEYFGDSFPFYNMDSFGPGVVAAFMGAHLDNSSGRVWFHPKENLPISELHFEYDPDNIWLNRIKEICYEAMKRWQGQVLVGMPDLGGPSDILLTFRPGDGLLLDLYDYPEEVHRLIGEIHELWHRYYNEINEVLMPLNPGYSSWCQIYSDQPSYVLQSDFSYMIGTEMFNEFFKPELAATCRRLPHTIYHLDGVGQLNHLDSLLEINELDAVQWVPGDGKPDTSQWPEVYKKIANAGKGMQVLGGFECLDAVAGQLGSYKGLQIWNNEGHISQEAEFKRQLEKYGVGI